MNRATPKGPCPVCNKTVTVRKDGTVRQHTDGTPIGPGSRYNRACPGTGRQSPMVKG